MYNTAKRHNLRDKKWCLAQCNTIVWNMGLSPNLFKSDSEVIKSSYTINSKSKNYIQNFLQKEEKWEHKTTQLPDASIKTVNWRLSVISGSTSLLFVLPNLHFVLTLVHISLNFSLSYGSFQRLLYWPALFCFP